MTVDEFTDLRVEELRRFFQSRFGRVWIRAIRARTTPTCKLNFLRSRLRPKPPALRPVEALAISLGFVATRLDLHPVERKRREKLEAFKRSAELQVCLPDAVDIPTLCSFTQHKLRARPLKDDVFPASFLENWCEETRMLNPCIHQDDAGLSTKQAPEPAACPPGRS